MNDFKNNFLNGKNVFLGNYYCRECEIEKWRNRGIESRREERTGEIENRRDRQMERESRRDRQKEREINRDKRTGEIMEQER